ncbi:hypothetical protein ACQR16_30165 [Bradyrhizobium oligotrophicum]|uniref:hypothetical protein n=1 Tax=Bradyrhizobium oligotrophicum TaxID=44255 RepID=UPI003EBB5219
MVPAFRFAMNTAGMQSHWNAMPVDGMARRWGREQGHVVDTVSREIVLPVSNFSSHRTQRVN